MTSRMLGSSASSMTMRSMPGAEPPCGGAPYLNAPIMPGKLVSTSSRRVAGDLERLVHDVRAVVADRARAQLHAVADDVILPGEDVERVLGLQRLHPALRHREGVVAEVDLLLLVIIFEHREIDDPAEAERALLDQVELLGDAGPGEAGELGRLGFLAGGEENAVVGAKAHRVGERVHAFGAVVLGDRAAPFAALAGRIAEAGEALAPRPFVHVVEEFAALFGGARRRDGADHPALLDDPGEQAEARAAEMLADVVDEQRIAQVGLVAAIFEHRFLVGNARIFARRGDRFAVRELLEHARQHRLDRGEHIVLRDEAHLEIELVEFAGRPVGAGVLVAEAGRDLEIAVEAGDHQQLLEHLRRLRKRVEFARMDPARHQIVARAFGRLTRSGSASGTR